MYIHPGDVRSFSRNNKKKRTKPGPKDYLVLMHGKILILPRQTYTPPATPDDHGYTGKRDQGGEDPDQDEHVVGAHAGHPGWDGENQGGGEGVADEHHTGEGISQDLIDLSVTRGEKKQKSLGRLRTF